MNDRVRKRNESLFAYHRKHPTMSYAALGRVFKLTRERVRQVMNLHKEEGARNDEQKENDKPSPVWEKVDEDAPEKPSNQNPGA